MYILVLLELDPERRVLGAIRDISFSGAGVRRHQPGGEVRHEPGERLLLGTVVLVSAVEGSIEQARMRREKPFLEAFCDRLNVFADHRQGGFDDGTRLG